MTTELEIKTKITVTDKDINDLLCCALEDGINYWADDVQVIGEYRGNNEYEHFLNNGELAIHLTEGPIEEGGPDWYGLDKKKFLHGLQQYLEDPEKPYDILDTSQEGPAQIDTSEADAVVCDMITQYALFNEIVMA